MFALTVNDTVRLARGNWVVTEAVITDVKEAYYIAKTVLGQKWRIPVASVKAYGSDRYTHQYTRAS